MQDLLNNFGVNPVLLVAQIINFLIILWLLKRFAYKPIFEMLDKRRKAIVEGVKNAEESSKALEQALEKEKQILKNAQAQAQEILTDAQKQSSETLSTAESSAKIRVEKILADAKEEIARESAETEKRLTEHTARLAVQLLEKSLYGMLDNKTQKEVVEKAAKRLKS